MERTFRDECLGHSVASYAPGRCLIIGEVAQAHDGSLGTAHAFIDAIANAGADAVKFQTHIAEEESTPNEPWRVKFSRQDASRYDYWKRMEFTREQWLGLKQHADERGLLFMSSPFSEAAVDLLSEIGMKVWKVASGEIGNVPLLGRIAATCDPVILSSGMSDLAELDDAVSLVLNAGNPLALLQCTSAYPCPPERIGLNVLHEFRERYGVPVGLSDHSGNIFAGLAAVTLGAEILEVHVAFSREMFGPDVGASVTTSDLARLVAGTRQIETMVASIVGKASLSSDLVELRKIFAKSIVAKETLPVGTVLEPRHLALKKPGNGIAPQKLSDLIGRSLRREVKKNELLNFTDLNAI